MNIRTISTIAQELKIDGFATSKSVNDASSDFEECAHVSRSREQAIAWLVINFFHDGDAEDIMVEAESKLRTHYQISDSDIEWAKTLYA